MLAGIFPQIIAPVSAGPALRVKWEGILPGDPFTLFNLQRVTHGKHAAG
jgi:hypothetical protein